MDEKEFYEQGESLAVVAAKAGVGAGQLRDIQKMAKTKSLPMLEAYIQKQTANSLKSGKPVGFDVFGPALLKITGRFSNDKPGLLKVLTYTNMLIEWVKLRGKTTVSAAQKPSTF
jgi:hypothetical protein